MKKLLLTPALIMLALIAFTSCQQDEKEEGLLKLGMELTADTFDKSTGENDPYQWPGEQPELSGALVTITDMNGIPVLDKEYIELIRFGSSYVTQSLKLKVGEYLLEEFMLLDAAGQAIWATPKHGSRLAPLVREPLPRAFSIHSDITTSLDLQVVRIGQHHPGDFGYAEFQIDFVGRFCLKVFFKGLEPDWHNDSTPIYDAAGVPWYEPRIQFTLGDMLYDRSMQQGINHYMLPVWEGYYAVTATNYFGQVIYERKFSLEELRLHTCEPHSPALVIMEGSHPDVVITEEGIREPSIKQGVFGQFMPPFGPDGAPLPVVDSIGDDVDTHLVHDLYIFPGYLMDSLMYMSPMSCIIPPEWIPGEPLAVVRSNTEGFFQLPLDAGVYTYMVLTDQGFYVDLHLSSRRGGYLEVLPQEVTKLYIGLVDCSMWMNPG